MGALLPYIAYMQGDDDRARAGFEESLELARRIGDEDLAAGELTNLGSVETRAGNLDRALKLCRESLELVYARRDPLHASILRRERRRRRVGPRRPRRSGAPARCGEGNVRPHRGRDGSRHRDRVERHLERTRTALGADTERAWDEGYALDEERAVAAARAYGADD